MRALTAALLTALLASAALADKERTWIEISVYCQCCDTPWGPSEAAIRPYFERNGVHVYNYRKEPRTVCAACSCPSPVKQLLQVPLDEVPRVREILERWPGELELPTAIK
jgi:hypothetical protein